jgi:hypothetical protein
VLWSERGSCASDCAAAPQKELRSDNASVLIPATRLPRTLQQPTTCRSGPLLQAVEGQALPQVALLPVRVVCFFCFARGCSRLAAVFAAVPTEAGSFGSTLLAPLWTRARTELWSWRAGVEQEWRALDRPIRALALASHAAYLLALTHQPPSLATSALARPRLGGARQWCAGSQGACVRDVCVRVRRRRRALSDRPR